MLSSKSSVRLKSKVFSDSWRSIITWPVCPTQNRCNSIISRFVWRSIDGSSKFCVAALECSLKLNRNFLPPQNIGVGRFSVWPVAEKGSCMILAYHIRPDFAKLPDQSFRFVPAIRLYEQGPGESCGSTRLGEYVQLWVRWAGAGIKSSCSPYLK
jgi:hypothetical protein